MTIKTNEKERAFAIFTSCRISTNAHSVYQRIPRLPHTRVICSTGIKPAEPMAAHSDLKRRVKNNKAATRPQVRPSNSKRTSLRSVKAFTSASPLSVSCPTWESSPPSPKGSRSAHKNLYQIVKKQQDLSTKATISVFSVPAVHFCVAPRNSDG